MTEKKNICNVAGIEPRSAEQKQDLIAFSPYIATIKHFLWSGMAWNISYFINIGTKKNTLYHLYLSP